VQACNLMTIDEIYALILSPRFWDFCKLNDNSLALKSHPCRLYRVQNSEGLSYTLFWFGNVGYVNSYILILHTPFLLF